MSLVPKRPVRILLVEDSPGDVLLTREALSESTMASELFVVSDGVEAMAFLHAEHPRPDIVLLDLNLPRMNGHEVLDAIENDPELRRIPVIMLTTSSAQGDILQAYDQHVNSYIRKPVDLNSFLDVVHAIEQYWIGSVALPSS